MPRSAFLIFCFIPLQFLFAQSNGKSQPAPGTSQPPLLMKLNVAAADEKSAPVTDLRLPDVQLSEDGKSQSVLYFGFAGPKRVLEAHKLNEYGNRLGTVPLVVLLDRWNESDAATAQAWTELDTAVRRQETVEGIYVYLLTNKGVLLPVRGVPTTDAERLSTAAMTPSELRAKLERAVQDSRGFLKHEDPYQRAKTTLAALDTLRLKLNAIAGRKNLVWVTQGIPVRVDFSDNQIDMSTKILSFSESAARSNIAVYTVEASDDGLDVDMTNPNRQALRMVSEVTGGRWYADRYSSQAIADAMADARGGYRLAYYSPTRETEGKEHKLRLETSRKGVRLYSRNRFYGAPADAEPDMLEEAAFSDERRSPFDAIDIGLRVAMSREPFQKQARFDIRLDLADVLVEHNADRYWAVIDVLLGLFNDGFFRDAVHPVRVNMSLTQAQFEQASKGGLVIPFSAPVTEGTSKVRVMVYDRGLRGLGSVTLPLN
jgi:VWFA-related protein